MVTSPHAGAGLPPKAVISRTPFILRHRPVLRTAAISFATLTSLISTGCACGRLGTLLQRRTITGNADVADVFGIGALFRPPGADWGFSIGWRHATSIWPRLPNDGLTQGVRWTFGILPSRSAPPFFLATRIIGAEVAKYPAVIQAHIGFRMDAFTFAARAGESRIVSFHYRPGAAGETSLTMNPPPKAILP